MAGHNKWSQIKHKKAKTDAQRSKIFTKVIKEITVAVKSGGVDIDLNPSLRLVVQKAKAVNMPQDTIKRAIAKAEGSSEVNNLEVIFYEAYGPSGSAFLIKALTDNRHRSAANIKYILNKKGGRWAEQGSVSYLFEKKGVLLFPATCNEEALTEAAIDAGAEDVCMCEDGSFEVICEVKAFEEVKAYFEKSSFDVEMMVISMLAKQFIQLSSDDQKLVEQMIEALDDDDDVQDVYTNLM